MPLQISREEVGEYRKKEYTHKCAVCGGRMVVAWGGCSYIFRCGNDISHEGITRHDKKHEARIKQIREEMRVDTKSLMTMGEAQMLQRVEMARFPQQLDRAGKLMLAKVALTYGFDPLMGEVMIYQGRPYVSIDGRYRMAQETGNLDGVETRPANKQEREDWQIPDGDYFFRAEVCVKGASRPFVGWGRVRADEMGKSKGYAPIDTQPQRMAEKRAEAQALRKAFHIPLPSAEDIGTAEDIPATSIKVEDAPEPEGRKVDTETGEIKDGEFNEPEQEKPQRDPSTIKAITDLQKALYEDFKLQPKQQLAELNIKSWNELAIMPSEAYQAVAAVRGD